MNSYPQEFITENEIKKLFPVVVSGDNVVVELRTTASFGMELDETGLRSFSEVNEWVNLSDGEYRVTLRCDS